MNCLDVYKLTMRDFFFWLPIISPKHYVRMKKTDRLIYIKPWMSHVLVASLIQSKNKYLKIPRRILFPKPIIRKNHVSFKGNNVS